MIDTLRTILGLDDTIDDDSPYVKNLKQLLISISFTDNNDLIRILQEKWKISNSLIEKIRGMHFSQNDYRKIRRRIHGQINTILEEPKEEFSGEFPEDLNILPIRKYLKREFSTAIFHR